MDLEPQDRIPPLEEIDEGQRRLLQAYKSMFESDSGKAVLQDLKNAFYERTCLNDEGNEYKTIAGEGKRFVVLYILSKLEEANNGWRRTD